MKLQHNPMPYTPPVEDELEKILTRLENFVEHDAQMRMVGQPQRNRSPKQIHSEALAAIRAYVERAEIKVRIDELERWRDSGIEFDEVASEELEDRLSILRSEAQLTQQLSEEGAE